MVQRRLLVGVMWFLGASCGSAIAGPDEADQSGPTARQAPEGLEQTVYIVTNPDALGSLGFELYSTLRNTGTKPVSVVARTCRFDKDDIQSETPLLESLALAGCEPGQARVSIAPGDTLPLVWIYGVSAPGSYTLRVRQVLEPEFRTTAVITLP
jgi:hypothetical protein